MRGNDSIKRGRGVGEGVEGLQQSNGKVHTRQQM